MKSFLKAINRPISSVLICLFLYGLFLNFFLFKNKFNITTLINAGSFFTEKRLENKIIVLKNTTGYDGQFYYRLALDPFTKKETDYGIRLDVPLYRQQRILYPFLTWLVSFHLPEIVPDVLVFLNMFLLGIIAYYGSLYSISLKKSGFWGVAFALYPGFLITLSRDLTEITAIAFLLAGMTYLRSKHYLASGILLSLAILAKETTLIVPLSVGMVLAFQGFKNMKLKEFIGVVLPIVVYGFWHLWLYFHWLSQGNIDLGISNNIGVPFAGIFRFFMSIPLFSSPMQMAFSLELIFFVIFIFLIVISIYKTRAPLYMVISWLIYLVVCLCLTTSVWVDDYAFMRALSELYILGLIILLSAKDDRLQYFILSGIGLWFYISINLISFR